MNDEATTTLTRAAGPVFSQLPASGEKHLPPLAGLGVDGIRPFPGLTPPGLFLAPLRG